MAESRDIWTRQQARIAAAGQPSALISDRNTHCQLSPLNFLHVVYQRHVGSRVVFLELLWVFRIATESRKRGTTGRAGNDLRQAAGAKSRHSCPTGPSTIGGSGCQTVQSRLTLLRSLVAVALEVTEAMVEIYNRCSARAVWVA